MSVSIPFWRFFVFVRFLNRGLSKDANGCLMGEDNGARVAIACWNTGKLMRRVRKDVSRAIVVVVFADVIEFVVLLER